MGPGDTDGVGEWYAREVAPSTDGGRLFRHSTTLAANERDDVREDTVQRMMLRLDVLEDTKGVALSKRARVVVDSQDAPPRGEEG